MIIITGCGRSGTSAVAKIVHESGLSVGHDLIEADASNAAGYYEERAVIDLNQAILNDLGLGEALATAARQAVVDAVHARGEAVREVVASATPAWKDPRFCWTLEGWLKFFPQKPRVIVCLRSASEVVASTLRYFGQTSGEAEAAALHTWRSENERLLEVIAAYSLEATCIEFEELHGNPSKSVRRLERFLDRSLDASGVRADLRHHAVPVSAETAALYEAVRALGARPRRAGGRAAVSR